MKNYLFLGLMAFLIYVASCSNDDPAPMEPDENDTTTIGDTTSNLPPAEPITTTLRTFIFGHSLINHEAISEAYQDITPPSSTAAPYWMGQLAGAAGYDFAVSGKYGFLPQHANDDMFSQWGFVDTESAWDSDFETFDEADFNTIMITAANFVQYQGPNENYFGEDFSPVDATIAVIDRVEALEPGVTYYIYENWPDMSGYIEDFPPTSEEYINYHQITQQEFHDWWITYHDELVAARPELEIKMIPVGPIIAKLLLDTELRNVPILDIYEDNSPHGRPTVYFLASMITYMAMYGTQPPADYEFQEIIHELVAENYDSLIEVIWQELENFDYENGESRVW